MSDMAFGGWQRRAARDVRPAIGPSAAGAALRLLLRRPMLAAILLLMALAGVIAGDSLLAEDGAGAAPRAATAPPAAAAEPAPVKPAGAPWLEVIRPIEIFSLEENEFSHAARTYRARRRVEGGGRQDTLALGTPGAGPAIHLTLYRRGSERYVRLPFFSDIARQAAEAGLSVTRSGLPDLLPTRFGAFEVADVRLGTATEASLPCSGYRLVLDAPALTITGLACGSPTPIGRPALRCLLERLDVASGGSDRALVDFFAASELKRSSDCAGVRLAPDQVHAAWHDDRSATPRRNQRRR